MECKNCAYEIDENEFYCQHCGGKIIRNRISLKLLLSEAAANIFGWDNKYFLTVRGLFVYPGKLLQQYIDGTRKRYMNPISFLLIGLTLGLFFFNIFSEQYLSITEKANESQLEWMAQNLGGIYESDEFQEKSRADSNKMQEFLLRYLNIITLINLPLYALLSWSVFRKRYNFGEHLVVNSYLQGVGFLFSILFFFVAIIVHPSLFFLSLLGTFSLYCHAYKQLYKLSWSELILKILLFIGILIGLSIVLGIAFFVIGYIGARFGLLDFENLIKM